jgi:hypothetical protein
MEGYQVSRPMQAIMFGSRAQAIGVINPPDQSQPTEIVVGAL